MLNILLDLFIYILLIMANADRCDGQYQTEIVGKLDRGDLKNSFFCFDNDMMYSILSKGV